MLRGFAPGSGAFAGNARAARLSNLCDAHGGGLERRLLRHRVPVHTREFVGSAWDAACWSVVGVPVAVVERYEDDARSYVSDPKRRLDGSASRFDADNVSRGSGDRVCIERMHLGPHVGCSSLELRRPGRLRASVEVVDGSAGGEHEWIPVVG